MRNFTKAEIDLCKKIAEKERRNLKLGDWMVVKYPSSYDNIEPVTLFDTKWGECPNRFPDSPAVYNCSDDMYHKIYFPLWQEHDCLEWLEKRYDSVNLNRFHDEDWELDISDAYDKVHHPEPVPTMKGKTPLEALLSAILAVMEN